MKSLLPIAFFIPRQIIFTESKVLQLNRKSFNALKIDSRHLLQFYQRCYDLFYLH